MMFNSLSPLRLPSVGLFIICLITLNACSLFPKKLERSERALLDARELFIKGYSRQEAQTILQKRFGIMTAEESQKISDFYNEQCNYVVGYINSVNSLGYLGECSDNQEKLYLKGYHDGVEARRILETSESLQLSVALDSWGFSYGESNNPLFSNQIKGLVPHESFERLEELEDEFFKVNYKKLGVGTVPIYRETQYVTGLMQFSASLTSAGLGLGLGHVSRSEYLEKGIKWTVIDLLLLVGIFTTPNEDLFKGLKTSLYSKALFLSHVFQFYEVYFGDRKKVKILPRAGFEERDWRTTIQFVFE